MNWARLRARDLSAAALSSESVDYDWSEGWGENWEIVDPAREMTRSEICAQLRDWGVEFDATEQNNDELRELLYDSGEWNDEFAPIVSCYYPLPDFTGSGEKLQAALRREHNNCAVVSVEMLDGDWEYVLALTGCGMNLSWDIAEAYIIAGYLPPAWLRMPRMADVKLGPRQKAVFRAIRRGAAIRRNWIESDLRDVRTTEEYLKRNAQ